MFDVKKISLFLVFMILFFSSINLNSEERDKKIISEDDAVKIAMEKCGIKRVTSIVRQKISYTHLDYYELIGNDEKGKFLIGIDPYSGEVTQWIKMAPYPGLNTDYINFNEKDIPIIIDSFLRDIGVEGIPKDYEMIISKRVLSWKYYRYQVMYKHTVDGINIANDCINFILNGDGKVIQYSKIKNELTVSTKPDIARSDAVDIADDFISRSSLSEYYTNLELISADLKVVFENHYFKKYNWEWDDTQSLIWLVRYGDKYNKSKKLDVWVNSHTKNVCGGQIYERNRPGLIGIADHSADIIKIWKPALDIMNYNTNTKETILEDMTLENIRKKICENDIFILQTHGDVTPGSEYALFNDSSSIYITPHDIPDNNLRYALISSCKSGYDGPDEDFKDVFISRGAACFQGYNAYIDPDWYEYQMLRFLSQGWSINNSSNIAFMIAPPDDFLESIVINWRDVSCYNNVYLAPIKVEIKAPKDAVSSCTIDVKISNKELANFTTAYDIFASINLPDGFTVTSGNPFQNIPYLEADESFTFSITVEAPPSAIAIIYDFDIFIISDNLGVAVCKPDYPHNKFQINFEPVL